VGKELGKFDSPRDGRSPGSTGLPHRILSPISRRFNRYHT